MRLWSPGSLAKVEGFAIFRVSDIIALVRSEPTPHNEPVVYLFHLGNVEMKQGKKKMYCTHLQKDSQPKMNCIANSGKKFLLGKIAKTLYQSCFIHKIFVFLPQTI